MFFSNSAAAHVKSTPYHYICQWVQLLLSFSPASNARTHPFDALKDQVDCSNVASIHILYTRILHLDQIGWVICASLPPSLSRCTSFTSSHLHCHLLSSMKHCMMNLCQRCSTNWFFIKLRKDLLGRLPKVLDEHASHFWETLWRSLILSVLKFPRN